jgi:hypothetical protein
MSALAREKTEKLKSPIPFSFSYSIFSFQNPLSSPRISKNPMSDLGCFLNSLNKFVSNPLTIL